MEGGTEDGLDREYELDDSSAYTSRPKSWLLINRSHYRCIRHAILWRSTGSLPVPFQPTESQAVRKIQGQQHSLQNTDKTPLRTTPSFASIALPRM